MENHSICWLKTKNPFNCKTTHDPQTTDFCIRLGHYLKRVKIEKQEREKAQFRQGKDKVILGKEKVIEAVIGWVCCVSVCLLSRN